MEMSLFNKRASDGAIIPEGVASAWHDKKTGHQIVILAPDKEALLDVLAQHFAEEGMVPNPKLCKEAHMRPGKIPQANQ